MNASSDIIFMYEECYGRSITAIDLFGIVKMAEVIYDQSYKFTITTNGVKVKCVTHRDCDVKLFFRDVNVNSPIVLTLDDLPVRNCVHQHAGNSQQNLLIQTQLNGDVQEKRWKPQRAKCVELEGNPLYDIFMSYKRRRKSHIEKKKMESPF